MLIGNTNLKVLHQVWDSRINQIQLTHLRISLTRKVKQIDLILLLYWAIQHSILDILYKQMGRMAVWSTHLIKVFYSMKVNVKVLALTRASSIGVRQTQETLHCRFGRSSWQTFQVEVVLIRNSTMELPVSLKDLVLEMRIVK